MFEEQVRRTPNAVAVRCGGRVLTYRELDERADALAEELRARGVGPDGLVGICVRRSVEMVIGLVAALKAGGAYLPLDLDSADSRLEWLMQDARPRVLLTQPDTERRVSECVRRVAGAYPVPEVMTVDAAAARLGDRRVLGGEAGLFGEARSSPDSLAYIAYTSGSTGRPKGVEILHRGITRLVTDTDYASFGADEVFLQLAPLAFDASTFEIWGPLLNGGQLVVMPPGPSTLEEIGEAIRHNNVTTLWLTAGLFHAMIEYRIEDLRSLRQLLAGGDVLSPRVVMRAREALPGCRLINGYGPTECTTFACCHTVETVAPDQSVPIGRPIAGTRAQILDADGKVVADGVVGELHLGGDGLARGYLNDPELTACKFIPDPFSERPGARLYRTGDLARRRTDGNIEFVGRRDQQVKIRGFRIELGGIEGVLGTHPAIKEVVVAVRKSASGDKVLVAYLVPREGRAPTVGELRAFLRDRIPDPMWPAGVVCLEKLPLTEVGKIDRNALPDWRESAAEASPAALPETATELQLKRIWERVLGVSSCGRRDSFFDLGGDSLLAYRLISEIRRVLHLDVRMMTLLQNPSIEQLTKALEAQRPRAAEATVITLEEGTSHLPVYFIQLDAGNFHLTQLASLVDKVHPVFATDVPLAPEWLRAAADRDDRRLPAIEELAAAHAALILEHQPAGACVLAGYCYTGILAWEVAAQLERHGRSVKAVLALDLPIDRLGKWRRFSLRLRAEMNGWRLRTLLAWEKANAPLYPVLVNLAEKRSARRRARPAPDNPVVETPLLWTLLDRIQMRAVDRYRPKAVASRAVLFNSEATIGTFRAAEGVAPIAPLFAGGLEVIETPGDHRSLVKEPHLRTLGRRFNDALEKLRWRDAVD